MDNMDTEQYDSEEVDDFGDDLFDTEDELDLFDTEDDWFEPDDAEYASSRVRRARAQHKQRLLRKKRLETQIRNRQAMRARKSRTHRRRPPSPRVNQSAIKKVDVANKVTRNVVAKKLAVENRRISGTETALSANKVVEQVGRSLELTYPDFANNPIVKTAIPLIPLAALTKPSRNEGAGGYMKNPIVWGSALAAGIAIAGEMKNRSAADDIVSIKVTPPSSTLQLNGCELQLTAELRNAKGVAATGPKIKWDSSNKLLVDVDDTGLLTPAPTPATAAVAAAAAAAEPVEITAEVVGTNIKQSVFINII